MIKERIDRWLDQPVESKVLRKVTKCGPLGFMISGLVVGTAVTMIPQIAGEVYYYNDEQEMREHGERTGRNAEYWIEQHKQLENICYANDVTTGEFYCTGTPKEMEYEIGDFWLISGYNGEYPCYDPLTGTEITTKDIPCVLPIVNYDFSILFEEGVSVGGTWSEYDYDMTCTSQETELEKTVKRGIEDNITCSFIVGTKGYQRYLKEIDCGVL